MPTPFQSRSAWRALPARKGIALLIVLAVLALMSVLAVSFVSLSRLERNMAQNYVDSVRATMVAESGIESAVARILQWQGALTPEQAAGMSYNPADPAAKLERALQPSFAIDAALPAGFAGRVSGVVGQGSRTPGGDVFKLRVEDESGKLNINDGDHLMDPDDASSGRLFLIVATLAEELYPGFGLAVAGAVFEARDGLGGRFTELEQVADALSSVGIPADRHGAFLDNITLWSWIDPNTIKPSPAFRGDATWGGPAGDGFHQAPDRFQYYDGKYEVATPGEIADAYADDVHFWRSMQHRGLALEPRAPVNVNAASLELIRALVANLQGIYLHEYGRERLFASSGKYLWTRSAGAFNAMLNWPLGYGQSPPQTYVDHPEKWATLFDAGVDSDYAVSEYSPDDDRMTSHDSGDGMALWNFGQGLGSVRLTQWLTEDDADLKFAAALYDRIHGIDLNGDGDYSGGGDVPPDPVQTWQEFKQWVRAYFEYDRDYSGSASAGPWAESPALNRRYQADLILANFCPNSQLNDFNPNAVTFKFVDKSDLLVYSTEFCLEPTGAFRIDSAGMLIEEGGSVVAVRTLRTVIEVFKTARITSQAQFFQDTGDGLIASQAAQFGAVADDALMFGAGAGSPVADPAAPNGCLTQSYPEPLRAGDERWIQENVYDGYVCLSTLQRPDNHPVFGAPQFRASFNGALDADLADYKKELFEDKEERPVAARLLFSAEAAAATPALECGNLFVDGGYSEAYRTLLYHSGKAERNAFGQIVSAEGNLGAAGGARGTLTFWVKPNWFPETGTRVRKLFSATQINRSPCVGFHNVMGADFTSKLVKYPPAPAPMPPSPTLEDLQAFMTAQAVRNFPNETCEFACYFFPAQGLTGNASLDPEMPYSPDLDYNGDGIPDVHGSLSAHLADRSILFGRGSARSKSIYSATNRLNHEDKRWPDADGDGRVDATGLPAASFQGHRWNTVVLAWGRPGATSVSSTSLTVRVNGASFEGPGYEDWHLPTGSQVYEAPLWMNSWPASDEGDGLTTIFSFDPTQSESFYSHRLTALPEENPMRFGEFARGCPNYAADATFDEITVIPRVLTDFEYAEDYRDGRYYDNPDDGIAGFSRTASYTTPQLTARHLMALAGGYPAAGGAVLRSLSWTCWWPVERYRIDAVTGVQEPYNRNPDAIPADDMNPLDEDHKVFPDLGDPMWSGDPARAEWDAMTVDIERISTSGDAAWLFADSNDPMFDDGTGYPASQGATGYSNPEGTRLVDFTGTPLRLDRNDAIRLRFFFNEKSPADEPLHESPVLDDITVTFTLGRPVVLSWRVALDS